MKIIIFDFDGVLIPESEDIKRRAWIAVLSRGAERQTLEEAESLYGRGRGGDRFTILRHVYTALGHIGAQLDALVEESAAKFDFQVQTMIGQVGLPEDARILLSDLVDLGCHLHVNSATPNSSLSQTIHMLEIDRFFRGVFGRPETKLENLLRIKQMESCQPADMVFIGDSPSDLQAAREFGCRFIAFLNPWCDWHPPSGVDRVHTHAELPSLMSLY